MKKKGSLVSARVHLAFLFLYVYSVIFEDTSIIYPLFPWCNDVLQISFLADVISTAEKKLEVTQSVPLSPGGGPIGLPSHKRKVMK